MLCRRIVLVCLILRFPAQPGMVDMCVGRPSTPIRRTRSSKAPLWTSNAHSSSSLVAMSTAVAGSAPVLCHDNHAHGIEKSQLVLCSAAFVSLAPAASVRGRTRGQFCSDTVVTRSFGHTTSAARPLQAFVEHVGLMLSAVAPDAKLLSVMLRCDSTASVQMPELQLLSSRPP